ncbi:MAG: hypothetical protein JWN57_1396, partial [Frankiales bacterium]|nr:hypothetical protein [Frankiales bacterium]
MHLPALPRSVRPARARLGAGAVATLLLCATGVAGAAPAAAAEPVRYDAAAGTGVVQLVLRLPAALPGVPNPVELSLLGTEGEGFRGAGDDEDVTSAASFLAGGNLVDDSPLSPLLEPLSRTLTADLQEPGPATAGVLEVPDNPLGLDLTVGSQAAAVVPSSGRATSEGTLAAASLGSLRALGLGAALDPALEPLHAALAQIVQQTTPLTDALAALPTLPSVPVPNPLAPILGGPATIPTPAVGGPAVSGTVRELPARVKALTDQLLDGAAVALTGVDTGQSIRPTATSVTAAGRANVASIALFGGLVTVQASQASASATAARTRSAASTQASATLLEVTISDAFGTLLQAVASEKGVTAGLLDGALGQALDPAVRPTVAAVDAALNTVLAQLTSLLESLNAGAKLIKQGTVSEQVAADGRSAEATATPAEVTLGLPVAPDLLTLSVGAVEALAAVAPAPVPA